MSNFPNIAGHSFLVTGGAGFIGSHICSSLLEQGADKVVVFDNLVTGQFSNLSEIANHPRFQFVSGDIRHLEECERVCAGIDFISHQAALGSVPRSIENPLATHETNASGFLNILLAARKNGIRRIVYASSSSVYGDCLDSPKTEDRIGRPLSPYALSKQVNEQYAAIFNELYGMEIIGLRYFNIFGPRQNPSGAYAAAIPLFIQSLLNGKSPQIYGSGEQSRDFTFVSNAVQANLLALSAPNSNLNLKIFNVACGKSISVNQLFSKLKAQLSSNISAHYTASRLGDVANSLASISRAKSQLGYEPVVNFEEGLQLTIEWFKKMNADGSKNMS